MRRLPLLVPLGEFETPQDFLSRLSVRNCRDGMRDLARDVGLDCQAVIDGEDGALERLAELGAADVGQLKKNRFMRIGRTLNFEHRGEHFGRHQLSRDWVRMCPHCMRKDLNGPTHRPVARPWRRAQWIISQVRTCDLHHVALVGLGEGRTPRASQDTSVIVGQWLPRLDKLEASARSRPFSGFEQYVVDRLAGVRLNPWLDALPMYVVLQACTLVGATAVHGPRVRVGHLDEDRLAHCDSVGFETLQQGEKGLSKLLGDLQRDHYRQGKRRGAKQFFGPIHNWLALATADPAYDPIRDVVSEYIINNLPVGPGDTLFKKPVTRRRIHSVQTAAREHGMSAQKLMPMLISAGFVSEDVTDRTPDSVLFEAATAEKFIERAAQTIALKQAAKQINASQIQTERLLADGLIVPIVRAGNGVKDHAFLPSELDEFVASLLGRADEELSGLPEFVDLISAQRKSVTTLKAVVELVVSGRVRRVGKRPGMSGFRSVLVDTLEVDRIINPDPKPGFSMTEAAARLKVDLKVAHRLVDHGFLEKILYRHPKNNRSTSFVPTDALERFDAEYVSMSAISLRSRRRPFTIRQILKGIGTASTFPAPIEMFRRSDIPDGL